MSNCLENTVSGRMAMCRAKIHRKMPFEMEIGNEIDEMILYVIQNKHIIFRVTIASTHLVFGQVANTLGEHK